MLELSFANVFELALKGKQELYKVSCLGMLLFELLFLLSESFHVVDFGVLLPRIGQNINDLLDLGHAELLVKSVVGGRPLGPELCLPRCSLMSTTLSSFVLILNRSLNNLSPFILNKQIKLSLNLGGKM